MDTRVLSGRLRLALVMGITVILAACSGSTKSVDAVPSAGMSLAGSVGDGPIVGADIQIVDATGDLVVGSESDLTASYQLAIPDGTPLPVIATATGGTDMVTGRPAEFPLQAIAFESGPVTLNMTPYTTLALKIAQCRDEVSPAGIEAAWERIAGALNLGWRTEMVPDPMSTPIDDDSVATVLLANEALGEVLRRTAYALENSGLPVEQADLIDQLGCDLADGRLDASGDADARVAATLLAVVAAVQLEVIAGVLQVDAQPVMSLLDDALRTIRPNSSASVLEVVPPSELLEQAARSLAVLHGQWPDAQRLSLQLALADATETSARSLIGETLTATTQNELTSLAARVALADATTLDGVRQRMQTVADAPAPVVSLAADPDSVAVGATAMLSWASSGVDQCQASGAWSGLQPVEGAFRTDALNARSSFTLSCVGLGGSVSTTTFIDVVADTPPAPVPPPTVELSVSATAVDSGGSVELRWTSTDADGCSASGDWSGSRGSAGSMLLGPLTSAASYTLTCSGSGGTVADTVTVTVNAPAIAAPSVSLSASPVSVSSGAATTLSWTASNADGCEAGGAWSGSRGISGTASSGSLTTSSTFTLTCSGPGGSTTEAVTVSVSAAPAPTLSFSAVNSLVDSGGSTQLNWTADNADSCSASGGWSGSKALSGSEPTGALTAGTTFTLSCTGAGGSVVEMLRVDVLGSITLNWQAPTENVDGSPLTDLSGYRIYYGESSRDYPDVVTISDAGTTSATLELVSGTYFVAMTALDADGNESGYSNEVTKIVQ